MVDKVIIAIQIIRETKGGDDGECRARRRTTVGWRPPRTTTQPCAHQRTELVFLFVWIAIITLVLLCSPPSGKMPPSMNRCPCRQMTARHADVKHSGHSTLDFLLIRRMEFNNNIATKGAGTGSSRRIPDNCASPA